MRQWDSAPTIQLHCKVLVGLNGMVLCKILVNICSFHIPIEIKGRILSMPTLRTSASSRKKMQLWPPVQCLRNKQGCPKVYSPYKALFTRNLGLSPFQMLLFTQTRKKENDRGLSSLKLFLQDSASQQKYNPDTCII